MRDAGEPQRQRMHLRLRQGIRRQPGHALEEGFRPVSFSRKSSAPELAAILTPLRVAPARQSLVKHFFGHWRVYSAASRGRPSSTSATEYGPVWKAGNVGAGAVDWIDDPGRLHGTAGEIVLGFFRQPASLVAQAA